MDDETDASRLFGRMLASAERGYRVLRAYDGRQALDLLRREAVDVILLDLAMPEMDGFEFLNHKAQDAALHDVPVILISARDPLGHPIVSKHMAVTTVDGLSARQIVDCVQALSQDSVDIGSTQRGNAKPPPTIGRTGQDGRGRGNAKAPPTIGRTGKGASRDPGRQTEH